MELSSLPLYAFMAGTGTIIIVIIIIIIIIVIIIIIIIIHFTRCNVCVRGYGEVIL